MRLRSSTPLVFPSLTIIGLLFGGSSVRATTVVPDPAQSPVPPILVGNVSGSAIVGSTGLPETFRVVVRGGDGKPIANSTVSIQLPQSLYLPIEQNQGALVYCPSRYLAVVTGIDGVAEVQFRFGGFDNVEEIEVRADGLLLRRIMARSMDIDGDGRIGTGDLALLQEGLFHNRLSSPETDFNQNGVTDIADFALFRDEFVAANGVSLTGCP